MWKAAWGCPLTQTQVDENRDSHRWIITTILLRAFASGNTINTSSKKNADNCSRNCFWNWGKERLECGNSEFLPPCLWWEMSYSSEVWVGSSKAWMNCLYNSSLLLLLGGMGMICVCPLTTRKRMVVEERLASGQEMGGRGKLSGVVFYRKSSGYRTLKHTVSSSVFWSWESTHENHIQEGGQKSGKSKQCIASISVSWPQGNYW